MNRQIPESVRTWAFDTIAEVSDEVGSERMGDYLLHYEGWSAFCLDDVLDSLPPDADVEQELFDAANDRSQGVIDEWVEDNAPDYALVRSGHERTGLYGVTWALFRRRKQQVRPAPVEARNALPPEPLNPDR